MLCIHRLATMMQGIQLMDNRRMEVVDAVHGITLQGISVVSNHEEPSSQLETRLPTMSSSSPTEPPKRRRQRRRQNFVHQLENDSNHPRPKLKVPTPIFVPSLPKSGTTSIHKYFVCGNQKSAHHVYRINGKVRNKIGRCVERNIGNGIKPFEGCGDYDIWSDTGYVGVYHQNNNGNDTMTQTAVDVPCYYPFVEALEQIYEAYPQATLLFITRKKEDWLKSIQTYHDGFIFDVWKRCSTTGFPGMKAIPQDFQNFYEWHQQLIRDFAKDHPSLTYIEVPLEASNAGELLEEQIGVPQTCWGHHNQYEKGNKRRHRQQGRNNTVLLANQHRNQAFEKNDRMDIRQPAME